MPYFQNVICRVILRVFIYEKLICRSDTHTQCYMEATKHLFIHTYEPIRNECVTKLEVKIDGQANYSLNNQVHGIYQLGKQGKYRYNSCNEGCCKLINVI